MVDKQASIIPLLSFFSRDNTSSEDTMSSPAIIPAEKVDPEINNLTSIIHQNARDGNAEKVYEVLIKCPDLVNKPDNDGLTALHYATKYGNLEVVEVLLNFGANADVTSKELMTPLHMSAKYCRPYAHDSTRIDEFDSSSRFKDNLSNSNRSMTVNSPIAIVDLLVRRGANVNAADAYGLTPLHYAAMKANTLTAQALLTNGANVNPKGVKGMTPLPTACIHGSDDIVRLLLSNGADCCDMDNRKNSVYHIAALHGRNNTLKLLLQYGRLLLDAMKPPRFI